VQTITSTTRWVATDDPAAERDLLRWAADRAATHARHLAPVDTVGRLDDGRLAVEVTRPSGTALPEALDVLGTPTTGVAVTLTVPLLELAVGDRAGALLVGRGDVGDVLVDDAGAVVFCDRPPASKPSDGRPPVSQPSDGRPPASQPSDGRPPASQPSDGRPLASGAGAVDGSSALMLAARTVWDRVDPREETTALVVDAITAAVHGDLGSAQEALDAVIASAPPRPVRWRVPTDDFLVAPPPVPDRAPAAGSLGALVRDVVEHGLPVGGRRVPLRVLLVGTVLAVGLCAAGTVALG
jgi:hypothetical protein